jgi:hypothetical protein
MFLVPLCMIVRYFMQKYLFLLFSENLFHNCVCFLYRIKFDLFLALALFPLQLWFVPWFQYFSSDFTLFPCLDSICSFVPALFLLQSCFCSKVPFFVPHIRQFLFCVFIRFHVSTFFSSQIFVIFVPGFMIFCSWIFLSQMF